MAISDQGTTRRQFLKRVAGGAGVALSGPFFAFANRHARPSPQSITYLDRKMYLHNMEVIAHFQPGVDRGGKMQMMAIGSQRLLFQQGDVIDISNPTAPKMYNEGAFQGGQIQLAYNKTLKKWILITGSQAPITSATPTAPNGKFDDPKLVENFRNFKGLRGIRLYDATNPSKITLLSEFSTGATGSGTHRNYYDGGRYAYLDTAPDDSFSNQLWAFRPLANGVMVVDVSDPANVKPVSTWWVPGMRKGEEAHMKQWPEARKKYEHLDQTPFTGLHGPVYVPRRVEDGGTRGYGSWGHFGLIILDVSNPKQLREVGRFDPSPPYGSGIVFHTIYCGILDRGFVLGNGESTNADCNEEFLPIWVIDVRDEEHPVGVAQFPRPVPPPDAPYRDFCFKRGRFGAHNPPHLKAPGRISPSFVAYAYFIAGLRCYDISNPYRPEEVAYFIPPQGGDFSEFASWHRTVDNCLIEWDRRIIWVAADTGLYAVTTPALGKPILEPMPVREWSLPKLNEGAP